MTDGDVFAERLLRVIDEGKRVATYKLALLLALIDACAEQTDEHGRAPDVLHTRVVARHVLRLYLPQVRLYLAGSGDELQLRQITNKRSVVLGAVLRLQLIASDAGCRTMTSIERTVPDELSVCLDVVEETFARYPIRLLQVVGRAQIPFLYDDVDWSDSVRANTLHQPGAGLIRFKAEAGDHLLRLAPLLRPLIELHWTRAVARLNSIAIEEDRLRAHLFGADRVTFPRSLKHGLLELQASSCFYCGSRLTSRIDVDHVLPWSRWPNDAIENLVLADRCNTSKSDHLVCHDHVQRWAVRLEEHAPRLAELAAESSWTTDFSRSLGLARSCYAHVPAGTPMWFHGDEFVLDDPAAIGARLALVAG